uniref:Uncharacterized protein n=1 Tax=Rhizophora mucronata TaxID=61149 RepID=A0A2P2N0S9_RHIMU
MRCMPTLLSLNSNQWGSFQAGREGVGQWGGASISCIDCYDNQAGMLDEKKWHS